MKCPTPQPCPVCRKPARPTVGGAVRWHRDTAGGDCPMSGKPFAWVLAAADQAVTAA